MPAQSRLVKTANEAPVIVIAGTGADENRVRELESRGVEIVRKGNRDPFDFSMNLVAVRFKVFWWRAALE